MSSIRQDLIDARALIEDPTNWVKGKFSSRNDDKLCHCAIGAVVRVTEGNSDGHRYRAAREALVWQLPNGRYSVTAFNDDPETTHQDVLNLFDRAIAA